MRGAMIEIIMNSWNIMLDVNIFICSLLEKIDKKVNKENSLHDYPLYYFGNLRITNTLHRQFYSLRRSIQ